MKKYLLLIVLLLVVACIHARAATKEQLEQSKDYLNDRLTYLLLQEFVKDSTQYQDSFKSISGSLQSVTVSNPLPYSALATLLGGKFDRVLIKFSEPVNKIAIQPFVSQQNEKAAAGLVDSVFSILKRSYPEKYQVLQPGNQNSLTGNIITYLNQVQQQQTVANGSNANTREPESSFNYWPVIIIALIVIVVVIGYRKFEDVEQKIHAIHKGKASTSNSIPDKVFYEAAAYKPPTQKSDIARYIDNNETIAGFQKAIADLQVRLSKLEMQQSRPLKPSAAPPPSSPSTQNIPPQEKVSNDEMFYMGGPVNNYFPVTVRSSSKENTVYKFKIRDNKQEAMYELHTSGAPINEIVNLRESYIKPACDEENLAGPNVRDIVTVKPGVAVLEGDKWIIKNKALIRYE